VDARNLAVPESPRHLSTLFHDPREVVAPRWRGCAGLSARDRDLMSREHLDRPSLGLGFVRLDIGR
jgi:hypothetical protein